MSKMHEIDRANDMTAFVMHDKELGWHYGIADANGFPFRVGWKMWKGGKRWSRAEAEQRARDLLDAEPRYQEWLKAQPQSI